jgi:hypothetical protein
VKHESRHVRAVRRVRDVGSHVPPSGRFRQEFSAERGAYMADFPNKKTKYLYFAAPPLADIAAEI